MSPNIWPAPVPFDPESGVVPAPLAALWSRSDNPAPALILAAGEKAQRDGWAAKAAIALAAAWADRGAQVVLADLGLDAPALHLELEEANTDGVADIFQFGASVRRMARMAPGRRFRFLPAGAYIPDSAEIFRSPGWSHLLGQLVEDRAALLAYLPASAAGGEELAKRLGRAIILADPEEAEPLATRLARSCTVELLLCAPPAAVPQSGLGPAIADPLDAATRGVTRPLEEGASLTEPPPIPRRRRRSRRRTSGLLWFLLLVTVVLGGWTLLSERDALPNWAVLPAWIPIPDWLGLPERGDQSPTAESEGEAAPARVAPAAAPEVATRPIESPIPYSVAVEAHQDFATAVERVAALRRAEPGVAFFLTPIPNQGVVYYRLLAGPVADTAAAWTLMRRLVTARQKTDLDPWSIRPTVWTYHLGDFESEAAAAARADELLAQRIPTYQVEVDYTSGPPRYRLFAGAYEGPAPAEVMADLLRGAGIDAPLVRRQGKPIR
jgi:hypothetical protein